MLKRLTFIFALLISFQTLAQNQIENFVSPGRLPYLKQSKMIQISSYDTTGANNDRINIHPGKTAEIVNVDGPGVITRIWITIDSRDPHFLRRILLRMYWDGEENPSVEVPVGDFFGTGFEYKHHFSQFVGMTSGGYFSYFPMPFNENARIEVVNETGQEIFAFYYQINYQKLEKPLADDVAYFHSHWRRDIRTDYEENYEVLDAEGEGHFVGLNMSMQPYGNSLWYLEGDEMVYVDGEDFPSVYGTGTEDYFTSGWYFKNGEFWSPYHGLIIKDTEKGRIAAYRFHVGDAIPFKKSLKFTIEHGHGNEVTADFSSTAYWYQKEPHKKFAEMPNGNLRVPLRAIVPNGLTEAEGIEVTGAESYNMDMSTIGPEWSGLKQLIVEYESEGDEAVITIPAGVERAYDVTAYFTQGPEYSDVEIISNGNSAGTISGFSENTLPSGKLVIKNVKVEDSKIKLTIILTDAAENSDKMIAGIDGFLLTPIREWISEYYMIGPFPNERTSDTERFGLDTEYPPEKEIDLDAEYEGAEGQTVTWTVEKTPESGYMSLWSKYKPYEFVIAYALTYVWSPEEQTVPLYIGSDDGSKVFLNDEEIYRFLDVRIAAPDQDKVDLHLKKGWNKLMLKLENNFGGYAFYARIVDVNDNLVISKDKEK